MGQLGVHFAIDAATAQRLLAAHDDDELSALIEEIEMELPDVDSCGTDKAWDAIHRCLTDGYLEYANGTYPLNAVILGGRQLYEGDDYIVSLLTPAQVNDVASALVEVDRDTMWTGHQRIDPDDYGINYGLGDFDHTWANFADLPSFFRRAALAAPAPSWPSASHCGTRSISIMSSTIHAAAKEGEGDSRYEAALPVTAR